MFYLPNDLVKMINALDRHCNLKSVFGICYDRLDVKQHSFVMSHLPVYFKLQNVYIRLGETFVFCFFWRAQVPFVGPLIPLFWTSGDVCPVFQSQGGSLACRLCCLHAMDSSDSPLVQHLLTSCRPAWQLAEIGYWDSIERPSAQ